MGTKCTNVGHERSPLLVHQSSEDAAVGDKRTFPWHSYASRCAGAAVAILVVAVTIGVAAHTPFNVASVHTTPILGVAPTAYLGVAPVAEAVKKAWHEARLKRQAVRALQTDVTVPNVVHYIYGAKEQKEDFPFGFFVNIVATAVQVAPQHIVMHYEYESPGFWWAVLKRIVTMKKQPMPTGFPGHEIIQDNYSHKTDFLRLQILTKEGGIYMDTDILPLRSLDDLRAGGTQFLMCPEHKTTYSREWSGLGSSLLLSAPGSEFASKWLDRFHTYDSKNATWAGLAIQYPLQLSKELLAEVKSPGTPPPITILPEDKTFFKPLWDRAGLSQLFMEDSYDLSNNYAIHTWNVLTYSFIRRLEPRHITDFSREPEVTYIRALKQALPSELREQLFLLTKNTAGFQSPRTFKSWLSGSICEGLHWCPRDHGQEPFVCQYPEFRRQERLALGGRCRRV